IPPELKTLPAKLLPRFVDLRRAKAADVVKTTPEEGAATLSSALSPSWLRRLYRTPRDLAGDESLSSSSSSSSSSDSEDSGSDSDSDSDNASGRDVDDANQDKPAAAAATADGGTGVAPTE
ncbi:unnamed protein product, partial [Ectocarpus sp. 8 AP-2014]